MTYGNWRTKAEELVGQTDRPGLYPQPGFQYKFLSSPADIVIGGGSAGGGKTFALLMEAARHHRNPKFAAMMFRRLMTEIKNPGGLWDEANNIYGQYLGGEPTLQPLTWHFPKPGDPGSRGARVVFSHLQYEKNIYDHKGGQYPLICFDELTSFEESQFWYLLSRNRSTSGVKPYVRATTNPESDGWVKDLLAWYLYPDDYEVEHLQGYPIPERDGVLQYFVREGGSLFFGNSKEEVLEKCPWLLDMGDGVPWQMKIKSLTFIAGRVADNKELLKLDPGYIGNLMALPESERRMLLDGCWKYNPDENVIFDNASIEDLFYNDFIESGRTTWLTADIAFHGSDDFVIGVWRGLRLVDLIVFPKADGKIVVDQLLRVANRYRVPVSRIIYDSDGIGNYLRGFLRQAIPYNGSSSPLKRKGRPGEEAKYKLLRDQCHFLLAEIVNGAEMFIEVQDKDLRNRLRKELRLIKKADPRSDGKLRVIEKKAIKAKNGNKSPDVADILVMRMLPLLQFSRPAKTTLI